MFRNRAAAEPKTLRRATPVTLLRRRPLLLLLLHGPHCSFLRARVLNLHGQVCLSVSECVWRASPLVYEKKIQNVRRQLRIRSFHTKKLAI